MIIPWRRLASYVARKVAENPEARAKAADVVQQVGEEARRVAVAQNRARAAGQAVRRVGKKLRRKLDPDEAMNKD
ncbi:MAG: hypothetical protein ACRBM6_09990 [Geminicoccales bacterium]